MIEYSNEDEAEKAANVMKGTSFYGKNCNARVINRYTRIYFNKKKYNFISFLNINELYNEVHGEFIKKNLSNTTTQNNNDKAEDTTPTSETSTTLDVPESDPVTDFPNYNSDTDNVKYNNKHKQNEIEKEEQEQEQEFEEEEEEDDDNDLVRYICLPSVDLVVFPHIDKQFKHYGEISLFNYFQCTRNKKW